MKFFILFILGILASCSCSCNSLDGEMLKNIPLDNLILSIYENGRENQIFELHLSDKEKARLMSWLNSFAGSQIDFNTYAPSVILKGQTLKINFLKGRTVISYRKKPDQMGTWKQYSRSATADDQQIRNWLKDIAQ